VTRAAHLPAASTADRIDDPAAAIISECERAVRRLNRLIGERNDILLEQARSSIHRAAACAAELRAPSARAT